MKAPDLSGLPPAFVVTAEHVLDGRPIAESTAELVHPYPREYARVEPDTALLARLSEATGGRTSPTPAQVFDPEGESIPHHEELWKHLLAAAIALFLLDLLLRRVRIFDREFR